jgi:hypothetical protein
MKTKPQISGWGSKNFSWLKPGNFVDVWTRELCQRNSSHDYWQWRRGLPPVKSLCRKISFKTLLLPRSPFLRTVKGNWFGLCKQSNLKRPKNFYIPPKYSMRCVFFYFYYYLLTACPVTFSNTTCLMYIYKWMWYTYTYTVLYYCLLSALYTIFVVICILVVRVVMVYT